MKVYEIVETREMLINETKNNYFVIYEETVVKDIQIDKKQIIEGTKVMEKTIKILKGELNSTLQKVTLFSINDENSTTDNILKIIKNNCPEVLN